MNRTRLLAAPVIGLMLMGAAGASAETMTNTVPKLGAATSTVSTCDASLTYAWDTAYDAGHGKYEVTTVTITGLDGLGCIGATLKFNLADSTGAMLGTERTSLILPIDSGKSFNYAAENVPAASVVKANIVIVSP